MSKRPLILALIAFILLSAGMYPIDAAAGMKKKCVASSHQCTKHKKPVYKKCTGPKCYK